MKKRIGREVVWLLAPVLVLAGVAWFQTRGGKLPAIAIGNPFDPGPRRVEYSEFQTATLTPSRVAEGFEWATQTRVKELGKWDVPKGWSELRDIFGPRVRGRIDYRRGTIWKTAPSTGKNSPPTIRVDSTANDGTKTFFLNLKTVPRDADEVRLRGHFLSYGQFKGVIPPGWTKPKDYSSDFGKHLLKVESKPFDLLIKKQGGKWPKPVVSRDSGFKLVKVFLTKHHVRQAYLQLRRDPALPSTVRLSLNRLKWNLTDANGKKVGLCVGFASPTILSPGNFNNQGRDTLSANFAATDFLIPILDSETPCGGWAKVKEPLSLELQLSEGDKWPLTIKTKLDWSKATSETAFPFR